MTTLDNGVVVDESITAAHITAAADVAAVFRNGPRVVESITIHHWGPLGQNFNDVVGYLASDNERESSAHFVAMEGRATCIVSPDDAAWHAGNAKGNQSSIGIELRPEATPGDYSTAAALIRHLRRIYGNVPLVPHKFWHNTACPGKWDLSRLNALSNAPLRLQSTPAPVKKANSSKMLIISKAKGDSAIWIGDGISRRQIPDAKTLEDYRKLASWGVLTIYKNGETMDYPPAVLGEPVK